MGWQDQGRQSHGWFGHGTSDVTVAMRLAGAAIGASPAGQRGVFEGWLARGGAAQLAAVLPAWTAGAPLSAERFRNMVWGDGGTVAQAAHAQAVGQALASCPAGEAAAGAHLAKLAAAAGSDLPRTMAAAARQADAPAARALIEKVAAHRASAPPARSTRQLTEEEFKQRNVDDLATVMYNEARGQGELAMTAVGSTLWNRMLRNHSFCSAKRLAGLCKQPSIRRGLAIGRHFRRHNESQTAF